MIGGGEVDEKQPSTNVASSPRYYSSKKVADMETELSKMKENDIVSSLRSALSEKDALVKSLEAEIKKVKETEQRLLVSLEESKAEISCLKQRIDSDSSEEDDEDDEDDNEEASRKVSALLEEMKMVKSELKAASDAEMTSKKAMDDLALALKEVVTDCSVTKEKLVAVETELEAVRLEAKTWKERYEEVKKETEVFKNTSERLRVEAEESLLAWNGKESVFVSVIKRGEDEKNSLLDENNKLLEALVAAENLSKKGKEENHKVRDILKQAISEANVAKEAVGVARVENTNLRDALLDKEEELQDALCEVERLRVSESVANENVKKLKKLLCEVEVAMEEEKHKSLSRQESLSRDVVLEVVEKEKRESKKEKKREKKEEKTKEQSNIDKKMIGKTCSFSIMKLGHHNHNHNKHKEAVVVEEEDENGEGGNSPDSESYLFKGSIFDVAETPHAQSHHKRRSSCTFLEEVATINAEDLESFEEGELNDKGAVAAARKKKAFIRRFGDLLVRKKSLSFSHKKDSSTDSEGKLQQQPPTPTSPSPPQFPEP